MLIPCCIYILLIAFSFHSCLHHYLSIALGQVMLYVDGMNGVMEHNPTVQWLYSLIASKYRLVAKTALKLLLVFVEYVESNCQLLVKAIETVDSGQGKPILSIYYDVADLLSSAACHLIDLE